MRATREVLNARQRVYKSKPEAIARRREYDRLRLLNPEVKARMRAYQLSPRGKEVARKASAKFRATEKYKKKRENTNVVININAGDVTIFLRNNLVLHWMIMIRCLKCKTASVQSAVKKKLLL